jgi:hypothetical protein
MKSTRTLTELVFFIMFAAVVIGIFISFWSNTGKVGVNGIVETMCIDGYKVIVGRTGHPVQMLDHHGFGVPCQSIEVVK